MSSCSQWAAVWNVAGYVTVEVEITPKFPVNFCKQCAENMLLIVSIVITETILNDGKSDIMVINIAGEDESKLFQWIFDSVTGEIVKIAINRISL